MVVRRRRKKNKLRGQRTHGGGGTKNRRGAGSRGGVGRAGSHKHKFSKYYLDFGVKRKLKAKEKEIAINLETISENISEWLSTGQAKKENSIIVLNGKLLGFGKVLGRGPLKEKIKIENASVTKKAQEKIVENGGIIEKKKEPVEEKGDKQVEKEEEAEA